MDHFIHANGYLSIYFYISKKFLGDERDKVDVFADSIFSELEWSGNERGF